jgi:electron transport complex protein RnfE
MGMGMATLFVLLGSNTVISLIKGVVPKKIRIPCYIVVIAAFVTTVELFMKAYAPPALNEALGIFIPLIVVNCIVLGRAEAFASKNGVFVSVLDALGMGAGFTLALTALGGAREFLTAGSLFDVKLITSWKVSCMLPSAAPGAFIILGFFLAGMNYINRKKAEKKGNVYRPPVDLDCRHCNICSIGKDEKE